METQIDLEARVAREREAYEKGLNRGLYEKLLAFRYTEHLYWEHRYGIVAEILRDNPPERALEIGSSAWLQFLENNNIVPKETHCINISESQLQRGIAAAAGSKVRPTFHLMDAHKLEFPDGYFDLIYGGAILHHLDMPVAYTEFERVLRPEGIILFAEPLSMNPVAKLTRRLTPSARTPDESALNLEDIKLVGRRFDCRFDYEQLFSVPLGILAKLFFGNPDNPLTRAGYRIDEWLKKAIPGLGPYYRRVLIIGRKRGASRGIP